MRRQRAVRTRAVNFAKQSSMGLRSGAVGWPVPECGPGGLEGPLDAGDLVGPEVVSAMTMSPGCRVGTKIW